MKDNIYTQSIEFHEHYRGKLGIHSKVPIETVKDLALAYTPGVSQPCVEISKDPQSVYRYTAKGNLVAVVTDGTSVLGLGDIGPSAAIPVMEGKAILFKRFGNIDAFPICINSKDCDDIVDIVEKISPVFGGILIEDIAAPRCFEIEDKLKSRLDIPVFHDDQHGTAVAVLAALINCLRLTGQKFRDLTVVINGAGAAGIAITKLLKEFEIGDIIVCDTKGIIYEGRKENMSIYKHEIASWTNQEKKKGFLEDALIDANVFIGVSKPNVMTPAMVKSMAKDPILFTLSNPIPEIMPADAKQAGAKIVCTGRSDFPNQVNNVLVFPGIFRGALTARTKSITQQMKIAAAQALANLISEADLAPEYVIPKVFDPRVCGAVASAVEEMALKAI